MSCGSTNKRLPINARASNGQRLCTRQTGKQAGEKYSKREPLKSLSSQLREHSEDERCKLSPEFSAFVFA
jgi:hypothetical protein